MRARAVDPEALPFVPAKLAYAAPMVEKPFNYTYGPPPGMPRSNAIPDEREVHVHSLRPIERALSLDGEGFAVVPHKSAVADFYDEVELERVYYKEVEALVAAAAGARVARRREAGFTLVELLVVLAILGLLVGIAVPQLFKYFSRAKEDAAKIQMQTIASGLDLFLLDVGRYPTDQEGLKALVQPPPSLDRWAGPYVSQPSIITDPWGHPYVYHVPGRNRAAYDLYTLGPDGNATGPPDAMQRSDAGR